MVFAAMAEVEREFIHERTLGRKNDFLDDHVGTQHLIVRLPHPPETARGDRVHEPIAVGDDPL
ncbi:hypothetical protein [Streptomyces sp. NPDC002913]